MSLPVCLDKQPGLPCPGFPVTRYEQDNRRRIFAYIAALELLPYVLTNQLEFVGVAVQDLDIDFCEVTFEEPAKIPQSVPVVMG